MLSSPSPTASGPPSPRGRGLFDVKNYFSRRGRRDFEDGHPTSRESVISGRMDSATSPSAPRRMTGMGEILCKVKVFGLEKPGIRESDAMRIGYWCRTHWLLMFCTLAVDTLSIDIDAECTDVNFAFIGCWRFVCCIRMLSTLIFDWFMFHYWAGSVLIMPFLVAYFNELFLLPLSPHPHVILHEGFTRSCRIHCF